ncbi:MAG TPA: hypothetical protein VNN08_00650 [Thermoanaerobaculia bacterium]|nr:hypothetical protein [Thermoanaerobaculia bacterium]
MYIWRIPLVLAAELVVVALLLALAATMLRIRRSLRNPMAKAVLSAAVFVAFVLSPPLVDRLVQLWKTQVGLRATYIDPSPVATFTPAVFDLVVLVASFAIFRNVQPSALMRQRVCFYAAAVAFFALNVVNGCSPGFCDRFGFPFTVWSWSDAGVSFDGTAPSPWSPIGATFDVLIACAAAVGFGRHVRRRACQAKPGELGSIGRPPVT